MWHGGGAGGYQAACGGGDGGVACAASGARTCVLALANPGGPSSTGTRGDRTEERCAHQRMRSVRRRSASEADMEMDVRPRAHTYGGVFAPTGVNPPAWRAPRLVRRRRDGRPARPRRLHRKTSECIVKPVHLIESTYMLSQPRFALLSRAPHLLYIMNTEHKSVCPLSRRPGDTRIRSVRAAAAPISAGRRRALHTEPPPRSSSELPYL